MRIVRPSPVAHGWLVVCLIVVTAACLPERRPDTDAGGSTPDEDVGADTGPDAAEEDTSSGPDVAAAPDVPLIEGCTSDKQCSKLAKNPCHTATCNPATGFCEVAHKEDGAACGDDESCRTDLKCAEGNCTWQQVVCNDDKPCTADECLDGLGCSYTPLDGNTCNDNNPCTKGDKCADSKCKGAVVAFDTACPDDGNKCTSNACTPEKGCHHQFVELSSGSTVLCDDGDSCTSPDFCAKGKCIAGGQKKCPNSDGNPCTFAGCHPVLGCGEAPVPGASCDLGKDNLCIKGEYCQGVDPNDDKYDPSNPATTVECKGVLELCDDDNPCTEDVCNNKDNGNCKNTAAEDGANCDDGDLCTSGSACTKGKCGGGKKAVCDDGNACTKDSCEVAKSGCNHVADDAAPCDDGSPCTTGEACSAGACKSKDDGKCDDGNACTDDVCGASGCENGLSKVASKCGGGACWWGQCLEPKCGNKLCQTGEDTKICASDCPAGGGECAGSDAACVGTCVGQRCKGADAACAKESDCLALQACVAKCAGPACSVLCLAAAPAKAVGLYQARHACLSAACVKSAWEGKTCAKGPTLGDCVKACGPAACWAHDVRCKASVNCKATDACIDKCATDVACEITCLKGATPEGGALQTALATCRNKLCL